MVSSISFSLSSTSRMGLSTIDALRRTLQDHVKRGATIDLAFRPHTPAVSMDDALHGRETDAGTLELLLSVQPLEYAEQLVRIAAVEAGAVVFHVDDHLVVHPGLRAHFDHRFFPLRAELDRVREQVHEDDPQQGRVAGHPWQLAQFPGDAPTL